MLRTIGPDTVVTNLMPLLISTYEPMYYTMRTGKEGVVTEILLNAIGRPLSVPNDYGFRVRTLPLSTNPNIKLRLGQEFMLQSLSKPDLYLFAGNGGNAEGKCISNDVGKNNLLYLGTLESNTASYGHFKVISCLAQNPSEYVQILSSIFNLQTASGHFVRRVSPNFCASFAKNCRGDGSIYTFRAPNGESSWTAPEKVCPDKYYQAWDQCLVGNAPPNDENPGQNPDDENSIKPRRRLTWLWVTLGILLAAVLVAVALYFIFRRKVKKASTVTTADSATR